MTKRGPQSRTQTQRRAQTRQRIVDAAIELHSTIGPARTSYSAVARRAGVTRPTVYAYFPDKPSLFAACSGHVMATDPPPGLAGWPDLADPIERLRTGLTGMYAYYRRHAARIANLERDMPLMQMTMPPGRTIEGDRGRLAETLATDLSSPGQASELIVAAVRHALAFSTWRSLTQPRGASDEEAVALMVGVVEDARRRASARGKARAPRAVPGRSN